MILLLIAFIFMGCLVYALVALLVCRLLAGGNESDPAPDGCTCPGACAAHPFSVVRSIRTYSDPPARCTRAPGPFSPSPKGSTR